MVGSIVNNEDNCNNNIEIKYVPRDVYDEIIKNKVINFDNVPNIPSLGDCLVTPWQMLSLDFLKFIPSIFFFLHLFVGISQ